MLLVFAAARFSPADEAKPDDASATLFGQLDKDGDGRLTASEIPAERRALFARLVRIGDRNDDGQLTAEEFTAGLNEPERRKQTGPKGNRPDQPEGRQRTPGQLFDRFDANGDGKVELDEVPEPARERVSKLIERLDRDDDGAVSRREVARARPGGDARRDPRQLFRRMDRDSDGKVSAEEVPEQFRRRVAQFIRRGDENGDDLLTLKEFAAVYRATRPGQSPGNSNPQRTRNAPSSPGLFGAIDTNRDGQLDAAEIDGAASAIRKLDNNDDGRVSPREIATAARKANASQNKKNKKKKSKQNRKKQDDADKNSP